MISQIHDLVKEAKTPEKLEKNIRTFAGCQGHTDTDWGYCNE